mmetsp:Transcript_50161/g.132232  ORF Transcript_50161/g.132232 Transcript_50161/m.132232 type:complete len:111 (+) Transcript_50161:2-334(+)
MPALARASPAGSRILALQSQENGAIGRGHGEVARTVRRSLQRNAEGVQLSKFEIKVAVQRDEALQVLMPQKEDLVRFFDRVDQIAGPSISVPDLEAAIAAVLEPGRPGVP